MSLLFIVHSSNNCTSIPKIEGAPDDDYASIGNEGPPPVLGWALLDLGSGNDMPPSQLFVVYADSTELEYYRVYISTAQYPDDWVPKDGWLGYDTEANDFTTPSTPLKLWRYIKLVGLSGSVTMGDPIYGPEIDAVGWNKP